MMKMMLERAGFIVALAADGHEALALVDGGGAPLWTSCAPMA